MSILPIVNGSVPFFNKRDNSNYICTWKYTRKCFHTYLLTGSLQFCEVANTDIIFTKEEAETQRGWVTCVRFPQQVDLKLPLLPYIMSFHGNKLLSRALQGKASELSGHKVIVTHKEVLEHTQKYLCALFRWLKETIVFLHIAFMQYILSSRYYEQLWDFMMACK